MSPTKCRVLTIAGADSGGGAGIQADLKTFTGLGAYGLSVITALTAQNTKGVDGVEPTTPAFVAQQMRSVLTDIGADAMKTGMLHGAETVRAIVETLESLFPEPGPRPPLVVDPVMVSTSGHELLSPDAEGVVREKLVPLADVVTPNIPEAAILAGWTATDRRISSVDDMKAACRDIAKLGCKNVLLKGGHATGADKIVNVLYEAEHDRFTCIEHKRLNTKNTHGTGCTLSAALAVHMARKTCLIEAVRAATAYVYAAMSTPLEIGSGFGPLDHTHNIASRALPSPSPHNPHPFTDYLIASCPDLWDTFTRTHPFLGGIRDGTLPKDRFVHFLRQDYIFLIHYARIHSLAAFKSQTFAEIEATTDIVKHIIEESRMHVETCREWGISEEEFHSTEESNHTVAYTRYVMDVGMSSGTLLLRVATSPCLLGYGAMGVNLFSDPTTKKDGNPYWPWICVYNGQRFQTAVQTGRLLLETLAQDDPLGPKALKEAVRVFQKAVRLEIGFWQMAWDKS